MSEPLPLLWLDLETTGLDKKRDYLLEVACFMTHPDGTILKDSEESWVIYPNDMLWEKVMIPFVKDMHESSGLIQDVKDHGILETFWVHQFGQYLSGWRNHLGYNQFTMAGSGVGPFDLPFLLEQFPELKLNEHLTYYVMDVGVVGRFFRNQCGLNLPERPKVGHRAMDDIKEHHAEFLYYKSLVDTNMPQFK